jgi:hypothetical protein
VSLGFAINFHLISVSLILQQRPVVISQTLINFSAILALQATFHSFMNPDDGAAGEA